MVNITIPKSPLEFQGPVITNKTHELEINITLAKPIVKVGERIWYKFRFVGKKA